jgi:7-keto-8-aminopelargonate synthetase-like enzyme
MPSIDHYPGRSIHVNGKEWLHFSGTAYLGLADHPLYQEKLMEGIRRYGANFGGSRRSNLQLDIFAEAESYLAEWLGVEAVLTVSSGSLAGQLLIKYLEQDHLCDYAPSVHPALIGQGHRFNGTQVQWAQYILALEAHPRRILLSSTVDPLRALAYDFQWLKRLSPKNRTTLVLDDSHGLGVLGKAGRGTLSGLPPLPQTQYILLSSMGKALGVPGGLIAGSGELIQALWESPFFGGASPIIPAYLYAFLQCRPLLSEQRERLHHNIRFFTQVNPHREYFRNIPGHPVFYVQDAGLAIFLAQSQILISSFHYPTAKDPKINRIVINAAHTNRDLEKLATLIGDYYQQ